MRRREKLINPQCKGEVEFEMQLLAESPLTLLGTAVAEGEVAPGYEESSVGGSVGYELEPLETNEVNEGSDLELEQVREESDLELEPESYPPEPKVYPAYDNFEPVTACVAVDELEPEPRCDTTVNELGPGPRCDTTVDERKPETCGSNIQDVSLDRYTSMRHVLEAVKNGSVALLRMRWLLHQRSKERRLPRRQDLPADALWHAVEFQDESVRDDDNTECLVTKSGLMVYLVSFSHRWRTPADPDPDGRTLALMCECLEAMDPCDAESATAVFIDWSSLYQLPRTSSEQRSFELAQRSLDLWYAHPKISVCRLGVDWQRGWMAFERAVSEFGHNYATVAEVGDDGVQRSWTDICRDTWARRELPSCPADFEEQMRTLAFSDNLDRDVVVRLYRTTFQIFSMSTETLVFTDMNWGDEDAIRFARVLPEYRSLQRLLLDRNKIGDSGARAIAEAIPQCVALTRLMFSENEMSSEGQAAVRNAWIQSNKATRYLSL